MKIFLIIILFFVNQSFAREKGETEITTDEGIEVFQLEKYYLLKKNVSILSDNFELKADLVKAFFEIDMYNITNIESVGKVELKSTNGLKANGEKINFSVKDENIKVFGIKSSLIYSNINMFANKSIKVNNLNGEFQLHGQNSKLISNDIEIYGEKINGRYLVTDNGNEIEQLLVEDKIESNIKTKKLNMYALKAKYNKKDNTIELFNKVKVISDSEVITGDYAIINTLDESYKIISKNTSKVKILIKNNKDNE